MRNSPHEAAGSVRHSRLEGFARVAEAIRHKESDVPTAAKTTTPVKMDIPMAEDRVCDLADITVNFTTIKQDHDLAAMLASLPTGRCECPHWGFLFTGEMTVRYPDTGVEEVVHAGEAFYMTPGHAPAAIAGTEFVMFSPADLMAETEAAIMKAMASQS
jgi:hypothetical protein